MNNISIKNFTNNLSKILENTVKYNEPIGIVTDYIDGNVVLISETEYNSIMETLFLLSNPKVKEELIEGKNTKLSDCISEKEIDW